MIRAARFPVRGSLALLFLLALGAARAQQPDQPLRDLVAVDVAIAMEGGGGEGCAPDEGAIRSRVIAVLAPTVLRVVPRFARVPRDDPDAERDRLAALAARGRFHDVAGTNPENLYLTAEARMAMQRAMQRAARWLNPGVLQVDVRAGSDHAGQCVASVTVELASPIEPTQALATAQPTTARVTLWSSRSLHRAAAATMAEQIGDAIETAARSFVAAWLEQNR